MKYKITVIKYEDNKDYEAELAKSKERDDRYLGYHNSKVTEEVPAREIAERCLEVFLTEAEYKAVKAEVIKVFE